MNTVLKGSNLMKTVAELLNQRAIGCSRGLNRRKLYFN